MERLAARFGRKPTFVVIGDGHDEELSAKQVFPTQIQVCSASL